MTTQEETEAMEACPLCASPHVTLARNLKGDPERVFCKVCDCSAPISKWRVRLLSSSKAARGMREALEDIAEHPGPNADDAAWCRHDRAKEALAALTAGEK